MTKLLENSIRTVAAIGCLSTLAGMFAAAGSTILLFVASPFIPDEQEQQIASWIIPSAELMGVGLAVSTIAAVSYYRYLPKESTEISIVQVNVAPSPADQLGQCAFCKYHNVTDRHLLWCAVHPSGPEAGQCRDFEAR